MDAGRKVGTGFPKEDMGWDRKKKDGIGSGDWGVAFPRYPQMPG